MIAWIIGIVFLLVISFFISDETVESFVYKPPTVVSTKVRPDLTCSDPNSSPIIDRFDKARGMILMGTSLTIPPEGRNRTLSMPGGVGPRDTINQEYSDACIEDANFKVSRAGLSADEYETKRGMKVFIEKDEKYDENVGLFVVTNFKGNKVDLFCCKEELEQLPGTSGDENKVCLPSCPSNYTKSSSDYSVCIRNDSNCVYTEDLCGNIQNNWFKTCATLYRQNANITSTINSISNVVSTFTKQTNTVHTNYQLLNTQISNYVRSNIGSTDPNVLSRINNSNSNFSNIRNSYSNLYSNIQLNITSRYNTLKADKLRFDTLFNNLACSNFM